ncbi:MAG: hypothetical protein GY815_10360 [Gammaproteobacteria bacterium]|nr:hypothetical protein [Gammaproteobacteria bacterium]
MSFDQKLKTSPIQVKRARLCQRDNVRGVGRFHQQGYFSDHLAFLDEDAALDFTGVIGNLDFQLTALYEVDALANLSGPDYHVALLEFGNFSVAGDVIDDFDIEILQDFYTRED